MESHQDSSGHVSHQHNAYLIIERAKQENFTEEEVKVYNDFITEAGVNVEKISEADADAVVRFFHQSESSNEFIANVVNRLAQVLPTHITSRILLSDNDNDGVPLYQELQLGTRVTETETFAEVAQARPLSNQVKSQDNDMEL